MSASQFPPLTSTLSTRRCTNCSTLMSIYSLPGHYNKSVEIDVCHDCNAIWFDQWESSQLSPDGTVALFQLVNERGGTSSSAASKFGEGLRCVTCGTGMKLVNDRVKNTRFAYQSCAKGHGRLTTFYNFLAEKQFVRELTKMERSKLAATVQQIKCSGCGASVNLGKTDACEYCRAPVSVFDRDAAKSAIDHYLKERQRQVPYQAAGVPSNYGAGASSADHYGYHSADLAADILFALGRVAVRGLGGVGTRALPAAAGAATVAGAANVSGAASAIADTGSEAAGGLLASIHEGAGGGLPSATDALFGAALGGNAGAGVATEALSGVGSGLGSTLSSATDALFGGTSSATGATGATAAMTDASDGFMGELGSVFSSYSSPGVADGVVNSVADSVAESAANSISSDALDGVADIASSSTEGLVDLVSDGLGSLLGSLFG